MLCVYQELSFSINMLGVVGRRPWYVTGSQPRMERGKSDGCGVPCTGNNCFACHRPGCQMLALLVYCNRVVVVVTAIAKGYT